MSVVNSVPFAAGQTGVVTLELLAARLVVVAANADFDLLVLLCVLPDAEDAPRVFVGVLDKVHLLKKSITSGVALK